MSLISVKILGYTRPLEGMDLNESYDDAICFLAKKYDTELSNFNKIQLIDYLIENELWAPFCHFSITVNVKTSRDIFQLFSNGGIHISSMSQTNSITETVGTSIEDWFSLYDIEDDNSKKIMYEITNDCLMKYDRLVKANIPKDIAKLILPQGMTYVDFVATGSLCEWLKYLKPKNNDTAIFRKVKYDCVQEIFKIFPYIIRLLED